MRDITLRVAVAADPVDVFAAVADFERYPSLADDVRDVRTDTTTSPRESHWVMNFRRGVMRWTETETLDRDRGTIGFTQTDGDFEDFRGSWCVGSVSDGAEVVFAVHYDFGIESLAGIMDPIAERVITRAVCAVLAGLFGDIRVVAGAEALTDLVAPAPAHT
jgi:ribosome-associated toxin RatA of RatAB toxin-antitoxin module